MPKNDPYSRPINATKPEHVRAMDYYGTPVEDRKPVGLAGNPNAARVRALPSVVPMWPDKPKPKPKAKAKRGPKPDKVIIDEPTTLNPDATSPSEAITEDDLFG